MNRREFLITSALLFANEAFSNIVTPKNDNLEDILLNKAKKNSQDVAKELNLPNPDNFEISTIIVEDKLVPKYIHKIETEPIYSLELNVHGDSKVVLSQSFLNLKHDEQKIMYAQQIFMLAIMKNGLFLGKTKINTNKIKRSAIPLGILQVSNSTIRYTIEMAKNYRNIYGKNDYVGAKISEKFAKSLDTTYVSVFNYLNGLKVIDIFERKVVNYFLNRYGRLKPRQ